MKRNIFAVCDLEVDYALNFMDYMNRKKNIPFEIQAFTSVENLIAYGKQTHIELLLISGRAMCREVRDLDIGKIIILSDSAIPLILCASMTVSRVLYLTVIYLRAALPRYSSHPGSGRANLYAPIPVLLRIEFTASDTLEPTGALLPHLSILT